MLEDNDSDSVGTVSDDEPSRDVKMTPQTKRFLNEDLTTFVKQIVEPVVLRLLENSEKVNTYTQIRL